MSVAPKVSVIVPCYNVEKYLPECLKLLSYPIFGLKFDVNKNQYKLKILALPVCKWRRK